MSSNLFQQRQSIYEQFVLNEINYDDYTAQKNECSVQIERLNNQLALLKQSEQNKSANKKIVEIAKTALSETATPKDIINALVDKVLVFPNNRIEIKWKFANF